MITDKKAKELVSANISRLLHATGKNAHWLVKELEISPGALYPIVRGEVAPKIGLASRIAECLGVGVDDLLKPVCEKSKKTQKVA